MISRKMIASLLAFMMILSALALAACGSKDEESDDPNLGVWNATTGSMLGISMDVTDFFGEGFTIELKSGGKCALNVDGKKASGKWTLENGAFTVSGGGLDESGRLENGSLVLEDVMGMGLTLVFEKEGGYALAGTAKKPGADGPVGVWVGKTVAMPGEGPSDNFMGMMAVSDCIFMELKADGAVRLQYIGEIIDTTWKESGGNAGAIDFDGMPVDFEIKGGELYLYIGEKGGPESLEYVLEHSVKSFDELAGGNAGGLTGTGAGESEAGGLSEFEYHPEHVTTFEGDWFGVVYFESGSGEWEGIADTGYNVAARFAFRDGKCEAFFSTEVDPGYEYLDFQNMTAIIGTNGLAVSGRLLDIAFENTLVRASADEPAIMYLIAEDGADGFDGTLYLRPWGENWSASDPWTPTDTNVEFVAQSTFEEIVAILGGDVTQIPAPTNIAGSGADAGGLGNTKPAGGIGSSGASAASSGPASDDPSDMAIHEYDLDPESDNWLYMSEDRLSEEELLAKYEKISKTPQHTMNYADVAALIGVDPSEFRFDGKYRTFKWQAEGNDYRYIEVLFEQKDGKWLYAIFSKTNM
ncbi:hypothetical protein LJC27_06250 [Christensenellaceae bacterium OttesenSCG-928-M15]|nr:hypothetical protein [Christensenellaceae bacterium OttesenSCG-928-M15]